MSQMTSDAIIKKLSKKTKMGEYDPVEVVEAMNLVEPGWTIELSTTTMQASSYSNQFDRFKKLWAEGLGLKNGDDAKRFTDVPPEMETIYLGYGNRFPVKWKDGTTLTSKQAEDQLKAIVSRLTKPFINSKALPSTVKVDGLYIAGIKTAPWAGGVEVEFVKPRLGVVAWAIKSPGGKELLLPVQPGYDGQTVGDPTNMASPTLWTWLYKETDIDQKSKAFLDNPEVVQKQEREQLLKTVGDKIGKLGTCAICERHQMLNRNRLDKEGNPTMVLHGYERPGVGYVIGNCFGVGYAPYELSANGCEAWRDKLVDLIENQRTTILGLSTMNFVHIYATTDDDEYREGLLKKDGTFTPTADKTYSRSDLAKMKEHGHELKKGEGKAAFKSIQTKAVANAKEQLKYMKADHADMTKMIKDWTLQPLPGTSDEDAAQIQQMKARLCPGSGTTNHDNSHTGHYMSQWARCNVCGQTVTVNKGSNKMRAHPPAKVKAMTASRRIDEVAEKLLTFTTPEKIRAAVEEAADLLARLG